MHELTEQIDRLTGPYLQCAQYGIFIHSLRGKYQPNYRWECQVSMLTDIPGDIAKACVASYLEDAYGATGIYYFKRSSDKPNQFRASFNRGL